MGLAEGAQPLLDQGRVGQHPAVQGGVIDLQAALPEQLLDVTIAERVAQVPRDGLQDQRCLEVPTLEVILGPALQLLDKGVQDHGPPPVRRRICRPQAQRGVNAKNFATRPICSRKAWLLKPRSATTHFGTPGRRSRSGTAWGSSWAWPGARMKATARPSPSAITHALVP